MFHPDRTAKHQVTYLFPLAWSAHQKNIRVDGTYIHTGKILNYLNKHTTTHHSTSFTVSNKTMCMHACESFRIHTHTHTHTLIIMLFSLPSLGLEYSEGQKDPEGEILSVHWTCNLELSSSLCQAFVFTLLSQNWKPISSHVQPDWVILWQTHLVQCATNIAHTLRDYWCFFLSFSFSCFNPDELAWFTGYVK